MKKLQSDAVDASPSPEYTVRMRRRRRLALLPFVVVTFAASTGCPSKDSDKSNAPPPPPPPPSSTVQAGVCNSGGGEVKDPVSGGFFPRVIAAPSYCVDAQSEAKTYGENAKHPKEEVCTTLFDGECEIYLRFKLTRVVAVRYVDGAGKGASVEIHLSTFADPENAYGMFTKRVIADSDPAEDSAPKPLKAGAAAVIGTGSAYVWKGQYLAELQYNNEQESPEQLTVSSNAILPVLAREIGTKLPGSPDKPAAAKALPDANLVSPSAIQFFTADALGVPHAGAGATGFYRDGAKRWRDIAIVRDDPEQAKDSWKALTAKPGSLPIAGIGDQAAHVVMQGAPGSPKVEWLLARKGSTIIGVGDEESLLKPTDSAEKQAAVRLSKEDAIAKIKAWLAAPSGAPAAAGSAPSASGDSARPKK